jgi:signal peptidase I
MVSKQSKMFLETSCELLRDGYPIRFCAHGRSMKPTIKDGELIIIEPIEIAKIKRSDIILYRTRDGAIAHRVMAIKHNGDEQPTFILRGDSLATLDCPVAATDILGRVVAVERRGQTLNLSSPAAKRLAILKIFLYKLHVRIVARLIPLLKPLR